MTELNRTNLPIVRDTKEIFSKSLINFNNNRPQKFIVLTILAYFGTKIFNNFFNIITTKTNQEELLDLISTIILSGVLFYLTGLNSRPTLGSNTTPNFPFYIGLLMGVTEAIFEDKVISKTEVNSPKTFITIKLLLITLCGFILAFNIFISTTISAQSYPTTSNYLIYIFVIVAILAALYFSKMTNIFCDGPNCPPDTPINPDNPSNTTCTKPGPPLPHTPNGKPTPTVLSLKTTKFNLSFGVIAWLMALTFLYDSSNPLYNTILSFLFGIFMGTYISNFSTFGVKYTVQSNLELNNNKDSSKTSVSSDMFSSSSLTKLGFSAKDNYDFFNSVDGKKYKHDMDKASKMVLNDNLTIVSKNATSSLFSDHVPYKTVLENGNTLTFYKNEVNIFKIVLFIAACITLLLVIVFIGNRLMHYFAF